MLLVNLKHWQLDNQVNTLEINFLIMNTRVIALTFGRLIIVFQKFLDHSNLFNSTPWQLHRDRIIMYCKLISSKDEMLIVKFNHKLIIILWVMMNVILFIL